MRSKSQNLIGENERVAGEVGVERLLAVEGCQHAAFPDQQIGIVLGEFFPGLGTAGRLPGLEKRETWGTRRSS
jgi:hypothetical protein